MAFTYVPYQKKEYQQSNAVNQAQQALQQHQQNKPGEYQSQWQQQMNDLLEQYQNRKPFQYDINADAMYQQMVDRYMQQGQQAMMDTMGQAAALTGGYGNSYAQTAGQQTYQGYLQGANDMLPQFYQMALDRYQNEGNQLLNQYNMMANQEDTAYSRYVDQVNRYYSDLDRLQGAYESERDYDFGRFQNDQAFDYGMYTDEQNYQYQQERDSVADSQWNQQWQYQQERDQLDDQRYAQKVAQAQVDYLISIGADVSDSLLAASGYDPSYTISHELTHFMEDQQPEQFKVFSDALFDALDMDVEAEIANKAEKLKRQQPKVYQNASEDKLMDDARSEVIAEACETMLTDTDAAQRIAKRIGQQDASLWEKIVQWFKDLSQKLRDAYNGLEPDSQIANDAKKTIQQVDSLSQMWADMAVDAAENYSNGTGNEIPAGYYASTNYEEAIKRSDRIVDQIKKSLDDIMKLEIVSAIDSHNSILYTSDFKTDEAAGFAIFKSQGGFANRDGFGKVVLGKKGIINTVYHGNGPAKQASIPAIKGVIEKGIEINKDYNHEGRGYDTVTFAAPVDFYGEKSALGVVVKVFNNGRGDKSFYIHEICDAEGNYIQMNSGDTDKKISNTGFVEPTSTADAADRGNSSISSIRNPEPVVNKKNNEQEDLESDFYNAGVKYSVRVTDKDTLSFLDSQDTVTTYKTMQIIDGKLFPPMASRIDGKHEDYSILGVWEQATEHPELINGNGKFKLDKGKGQGSIEAAYNPYMHSSNLVINDQFTGAYTRDNLVTGNRAFHRGSGEEQEEKAGGCLRFTEQDGKGRGNSGQVYSR